MKTPKKWTEIYPYGTKEGDEEAAFFRAIARNPKYEYRSVAAIVKTSGLSRERVEQIINKYANKIQPPLIYPNPKNDDHWGYWERCQDDLKSDDRSLGKKDKDSRVDGHLTDKVEFKACLQADDEVLVANKNGNCFKKVSSLDFFTVVKKFDERTLCDVFGPITLTDKLIDVQPFESSTAQIYFKCCYNDKTDSMAD